MSSIEISRPIKISMEVVEIDNYLPSIKMAVGIELTHPTGTFSYNANDLWFECSSWDNFTLSLKSMTSGSNCIASLKSMSDAFSIVISFKNRGMIFSLESEEVNIGGGKTILSYQSEIDDDLLGFIRTQFADFEKWW